jgi:3-hydroxyisobutyrate dehydrogenase-like beta-hydroxyacid dehydrogenase
MRFAIPNQVLTGDYTPGFRTVLGQKDLRLGRDLAARLGVPLQTLAISAELYTAAVAKGRGDWSAAAIVTVLEDIVGLKLADLAAEQAANSKS